MADDRQVKKYFENLPYTKNTTTNKIHGKENQLIIDGMVTDLLHRYDEAKAAGNKKAASAADAAIRKIGLDCDNLQIPKEEFARLYGAGKMGASQFSNATDLTWEKKFMIEQGTIGFDPRDMSMVLSVVYPDGQEVSKKTGDITQDWVVKGTADRDFMTMQQDVVKQSNTMGNKLDFDIDYHIDNWLHNGDNWKSALTDKVGGKFMLHQYLQDNQEAVNSGEISDEMLKIESFHPETDTRLHRHYADILKKSFDPNYQTASEKQEGAMAGKTGKIDLSSMMEEEEKMKAIKQGKL